MNLPFVELRINLVDLSLYELIHSCPGMKLKREWVKRDRHRLLRAMTLPTVVEYFEVKKLVILVNLDYA